MRTPNHVPVQPPSRAPAWLAYAGLVLALLGLLWTAATQWQDVKDRLSNQEKVNRFYHGDLVPPKEAR